MNSSFACPPCHCRFTSAQSLRKRSLAISEPVDLGEDLESYVARLIESGRFDSREAVLRDGVRLVQQREAAIGELRLRYLQGLALAERGNVQEAEKVLSELREQLVALKPEKKIGN